MHRCRWCISISQIVHFASCAREVEFVATVAQRGKAVRRWCRLLRFLLIIKVICCPAVSTEQHLYPLFSHLLRTKRPRTLPVAWGERDPNKKQHRDRFEARRDPRSGRGAYVCSLPGRSCYTIPRPLFQCSAEGITNKALQVESDQGPSTPPIPPPRQTHHCIHLHATQHIIIIMTPRSSLVLKNLTGVDCSRGFHLPINAYSNQSFFCFLRALVSSSQREG